FFGTTDPPLEARLVARRSWDRKRNPCFGGKMFLRWACHRYRQRSRGDFGGQIKRPIEQNSWCPFSIRRCAQMELVRRERRNHSKFIQRFTYRNPPGTRLQSMANCIRNFAEPAKRLGARAPAEPPRCRRCEAARKMGCHSGRTDPQLCGRRKATRQIF